MTVRLEQSVVQALDPPQAPSVFVPGTFWPQPLSQVFPMHVFASQPLVVQPQNFVP